MGFWVLHYIVFFISFSLCSGHLVKVAYDIWGISSSPTDLLNLLKRKGATDARVFYQNPEILSMLCKNGVNIDLHTGNKKMVDSFESPFLDISWVTKGLLSFASCNNKNSITFDTEFMDENDVQRVLPSLKSLNALLSSLKLENRVTLSASFSLSSLKKYYNESQILSSVNLTSVFLQVVEFLSTSKHRVTLHDACEDGLNLIHCLIRTTNRALSVVPKKDIPIQIDLNCGTSCNPSERIAIQRKMMRLLEEYRPSPPNSISFSIEIPMIDQVSSSRRGLLADTQFDVVTPITTVPIINPTYPVTSTTPSTLPVTDPITLTTPSIMPSTNPITTPTSRGGSWCIASQTASQTALQVALDYACGYGGTDCSAIQIGGSCYNPNTLHDHASYAFNSYYQKNPVPTSCNFGGTAIVTNIDPSSGICRYPSSSTSFSVLNTTNPAGSTIFGSEPSGTTNSAVGSISFAPLLILASITIPLLSLDFSIRK